MAEAWLLTEQCLDTLRFFRDDMSMRLHIKNVHRISTIRHLLSADSTKTLVSAFVLSRLDYCNSLLSGCPKHLLEKLQKVHNSAARLVLKAHKRDHVSPLLRTLHWLPIQARIEYKLSTVCHSFFSDTAPVYLSDLLRVYSPSRQLCSSSDSRTFCIPHIKTKTFGHRSFSHAAPSVSNSLPHDIRHIQSVTAFKTALEDSSVQILPLLVKPVLPPPLSVNYITWLAVWCVCVCVYACVCVCVCVWEREARGREREKEWEM